MASLLLLFQVETLTDDLLDDIQVVGITLAETESDGSVGGWAPDNGDGLSGSQFISSSWGRDWVIGEAITSTSGWSWRGSSGWWSGSGARGLSGDNGGQSGDGEESSTEETHVGVFEIWREKKSL